MKKFDLTPEQNAQGKKSAITILIFLIVVASLIIKCSCGGNDKKDEVKKYTKIDALVQSQGYIEKKLLSPGSANFETGTEGVAQINDTIFTVNSYVDSQNGFGALIRTRYSCKMTFHPKTDTHDIENIVMK